MNRLFAGSVLLAAIAAPGMAQARQAECLMIVNGNALIDGRCEFDSGSDGSFRMESSRFIGHVMVERPGVGSGMWTAKPEVRDAYRQTGALRRNGACWENNTATYCAWGLGQRPQGQQFGQQGAQAPSTPPQQFVQAAPLRATAAEACPPRGSARSVDSTQTANVQFVNQTGATLRLYWLDYKGERKHYADIQPNGQLNQQTYVSHPWILVDPQGGCAGGVFYPRAGNQRHLLASAASPAPSGGFAQPVPPRPQQQAAPAPAIRIEAQPAAGGWQTLRYFNEATGRLTRCGIQRDYSSGGMLRFTAAMRANQTIAITTHFSSPRFNAASMPERFEVRYWVDDENSTQKILAVREGANGARFTENNANEPGSEDAWANGKDFAVAIGQQVLSFPLKGSNPMFKNLFDCAHKQLASAQPQQPRPQAQQPAPQQPRPQMAPAPGTGAGAQPPAGGQLRRDNVRALPGGWQFARVMSGQRLNYCEVMILTGAERGVRMAQGANSTVYGFSGYGSASLGARVQLRVWFDNKRNEATTEQAELVKDADGVEWLSIRVSNNEPGGLHDLFANASRVSFGYNIDGRQHVENFTLTGSNTAVTAMTDCATGRR